MPFRDATTHLRDIQESIDLIEAFLKDMEFATYQTDSRTKSAVERQLQIITEAAIRLGNDGEAMCPGQDWKGFRGMGNILRHEYHRVEDKIVWDTAKVELPKLKAAIVPVLNASSPELDGPKQG